jgi:hypothetical protein
LKVIEGYISHSRRIFVDCLRHQAGLPDGIFSKQKCQTGYILEGLTIEDFGHILCPFGLFYCHLVYLIAIWSILLPFGLFNCHLVCFIAIWSILWLFGKFCGYLLYFSRFGMLYQEKSGYSAIKCASICLK